MPQTGTQTCTNQHNKHRFIALSESSKRMHKAAAAADVRVGQHTTHTYCSTPPAPAGRTHSKPPAHRLEGPRYCSASGLA